MNPSDPTQSSPLPTESQPPSPTQLPPQSVQPQMHNPLSVMEPGEQTVCEIKRHPIGMIGIYAISGLVIVVLAILAFGVAPHFITSTSRQHVLAAGGLIFIIFAVLCLGFVAITHKIYWGNRWIVTSDSLTQVMQSSLFDKQSSQLSLGNLEDVSVEQEGPIMHMFNYGQLRVETAGERSKFVFPFCPNPNYYAQQILQAREAFEQGRQGGDEQRLYRAQGAYQASQPLPPAPTSSQPTAQPAVYPTSPQTTAPVSPAPVTPAPLPSNPVPTPDPDSYPDDTSGVNINAG